MSSILPSKYENTDFFNSVQPYGEPFPLSNALLPLPLRLQSLDIPGDQEDDGEDEVHSSVFNNDDDDDFDIVTMVANDVPKCTYITKTLVRCPLSVFSNTPRKRPSWPDHKIAMQTGAKVW